MYAIVKDGGRQYRCEVGRKMWIELRDVNEGDKIELDQVLLLAKDDSVVVGQPTVAGAKVLCTVEREAKGPKLVIRWFRRRKNSRKKNGHRQRYTQVIVDEIVG